MGEDVSRVSWARSENPILRLRALGAFGHTKSQSKISGLRLLRWFC